jgi:hypothetical protein
VARFATAAELASLLQQDVDTSSAEQALDMATAEVQNLVGQLIEQDTVVAHLWVTDPCEQLLTMPQRPVTAVTAVTIDGTAVTDYTVLPHALWREDGWIDGAQESAGQPIRVTVAHTYGFATIPDDIKRACLHLAAQMYVNPEGSGGGERIDDYQAPRYSSAEASLPPIFERNLRAKYGAGAYVL